MRPPSACRAARSGVAWFAVDRAARALTIDLNAPAQMRPRQALTLPIKVAGLQPGEEARVTVAAVDVGILNLTRYRPRNPPTTSSARDSSTEIRDLYGYLIDGMQGTRGAIRSGGDAAAKGLEGIPPTQEPLAATRAWSRSARTARPVTSTSRPSTARRG